MKSDRYTTMLTIAGSDPSGGAGIQADIRTASLLGVHPLSTVTALTFQNTCGVSGYYPTDIRTLVAQIGTILSDIRPDAVKTGMIPSYLHAEAIGKAVKEHRLTNLVVDPVLSATSGGSISGDSLHTMEAIKEYLLPLAEIVTPNIPEAELFLGHKIQNIEDAMGACVEFAERFSCNSVLLKGGHLPMYGTCTDIFFRCDTQELIQFPHSFIPSGNLHGTGCVLSSAIASFLASGKTPAQAVAFAGKFLHDAIYNGKDRKLGHGNGPLFLFP